MRLGCIGIGSNAIRLLVASWKDGQLCDVRRERRGTRLFAGLIGGRLTEESIQSSVNAVDELAQCARGDGAQEIFVFATSAVRDAANGRAFTDRCEAACGARVEIVSGEEEAVLSYIGASDGGVCGMIDIGGGSTEFTLGEGEKIRGAVSLQMGAVRMNAQRPVLRLDDYAATVEQCRRLIQRDAQGLLTLGMKPGWVGVGGTMTTRIWHGLDPPFRARQHGRLSEEKISKKGLTEAEKLCIMILVVRTTALHIAGWSSLAARRAHNPKVVGSNPTPATIWRHSSAGQSIRFIPEVSCVRITLPLPENPVKMIAWLDFSIRFFSDPPARQVRAVKRKCFEWLFFLLSTA